MPDNRKFEEKIPLDIGGVDYAEHSKLSRAKKVVPGPLFADFKRDANGDPVEPQETVDSLNPAPGGNTVLQQDCAYRIISDGPFYYKLSSGGTPVVATAGNGIYVPANTAVIIAMRGFVNFNTVGSGAFINIVKVR